MSFHEKTESIINKACVHELAQSVLEHGDKFNSMHEAWAVLIEEIEEVECEFSDLKSDFEAMWHCVKMNNKEGVNTLGNDIQKSAIRAMKELAQVWAVCEKMKAKSPGVSPQQTDTAK